MKVVECTTNARAQTHDPSVHLARTCVRVYAIACNCVQACACNWLQIMPLNSVEDANRCFVCFGLGRACGVSVFPLKHFNISMFRRAWRRISSFFFGCNAFSLHRVLVIMMIGSGDDMLQGCEACHRYVHVPLYCARQCPSIDRAFNPMWSAMSID